MDLKLKPALTRRKFLFGTAALAALGGVSAADMRWFEPQALQLHAVKVTLSRASATTPVRVLHLSDFHASEFVSYEFIDEAVTLALAQKPDVVALTGDFFTNVLVDGDRFARILRRLSEAAPTFGCLGNHDGGPWTHRAGGYAGIHEVQELLHAGGVSCLLNASQSLTVHGRALQMIGVGDLWSKMCVPDTAFSSTPPRNGAMRVLLNHNPDAKNVLGTFDWDLMLCGHTHGGQLRLPLIGTPFAPVVDRRYVEGLHRWEKRWLYVTRGVGNLHGLRFNCRPQVSVLDIT